MEALARAGTSGDLCGWIGTGVVDGWATTSLPTHCISTRGPEIGKTASKFRANQRAGRPQNFPLAALRARDGRSTSAGGPEPRSETRRTGRRDRGRSIGDAYITFNFAPQLQVGDRSRASRRSRASDRFAHIKRKQTNHAARERGREAHGGRGK